MNFSIGMKEMHNDDLDFEIEKLVRSFDSDREILPTKIDPLDDAAGIIPLGNGRKAILTGSMSSK